MGGYYCVYVHSKLDLVVTVAFVFTQNWVVTIVFVFRLNGNRVQLSCARHMRACIRLAWQGFVKTRFYTLKLVLLSSTSSTFRTMDPPTMSLEGCGAPYLTQNRTFHPLHGTSHRPMFNELSLKQH